MRKYIFLLCLLVSFIFVQKVNLKASDNIVNNIKNKQLIIYKGNSVLEYGEDINVDNYFYIDNAELIKAYFDSKTLGKQETFFVLSDNKRNYKIKKEIEVVDTQFPLIEIKTDKVKIYEGTDFDILSNIAKCLDVIDGDLEPKINGTFDKNKIGTYKIEVISTDKNNNVSKKEFEIEVVELKKIKFNINTNAMPTVSSYSTSNRIAKKIHNNFKNGINKTIFKYSDGYSEDEMYNGTKTFSDVFLGRDAWSEIEFLVTKNKEQIEVTIIQFEEAKKYYQKQQNKISTYKSQVYNALSKMNLYTTQEDMAQQINNYIVNNFSYKLINVIDVTYFMQNKQGKCWHYAMLFRDMCKAVGLNVQYIEGYAYGEYHAWNSIVIDGKKYYFDSTLNDTMHTNKFSLLTKEALSKTHSW